jgi:hypothetical protein
MKKRSPLFLKQETTMTTRSNLIAIAVAAIASIAILSPATAARNSSSAGPSTFVANGRHGGVVHFSAKCGVNSLIAGGTLRGPDCRLR